MPTKSTTEVSPRGISSSSSHTDYLHWWDDQDRNYSVDSDVFSNDRLALSEESLQLSCNLYRSVEIQTKTSGKASIWVKIDLSL